MMKTYAKVKKGISKVTFPPKCRGAAESLIKGLMEQDPSLRLPMLYGGTANVEDHDWYMYFDWPAFKALKMEQPYKPSVNGKADLSNFCDAENNRPPKIFYMDDGSGWDANFATIT